MTAQRALQRPVDAHAAAPPDNAGRGLRERAMNFRSACRQVFGIPDYDRYLAHAAIWHPGEPVLARRAFFAQAIDRKYGQGAGARCC